MKSFRDLLPGPDSAAKAQNTTTNLSSSSSSSTRRRQPTKIACTACRRRKSKCDGQRPMCALCAASGLANCEYDGDPDESRANAMKRKHDDLQRRVELLQELFELLTTRTEQESMAILHRMRAMDLETDIETLINLIKSGDLLLEFAEAGLVRDSIESPDTAEFFNADDQSLPHDVAAVIRILNKKIAELDAPSRAIFLKVLKDRQAALVFNPRAGQSNSDYEMKDMSSS